MKSYQPATCTHSVGRCPILRTCPKCKVRFGSRGGMTSHYRVCKAARDEAFEQHQSKHWEENHTHEHEKVRTNQRKAKK